MSAPFTPDDFKALISDPGSTMCGNFINTLLRLPVKLYDLVNYLFDSSGNPTKAFLNGIQPTGSLIVSMVPLSEDGTRLLADGREVSATTYPDLAGKLGTIFGAASPGNVKLPDCRGKYLVGLNSSGSATFDGVGGTISIGTPVGATDVKLTPAQQGSLAVTTSCDDGDAATGARVSLESLTINGTSFGNAGADAVQGPFTIRLQDDAAHFAIIPPSLGTYIYIVT